MNRQQIHANYSMEEVMRKFIRQLQTSITAEFDSAIIKGANVWSCIEQYFTGESKQSLNDYRFCNLQYPWRNSLQIGLLQSNSQTMMHN